MVDQMRVAIYMPESLAAGDFQPFRREIVGNGEIESDTRGRNVNENANLERHQ